MRTLFYGINERLSGRPVKNALFAAVLALIALGFLPAVPSAHAAENNTVQPAPTTTAILRAVDKGQSGRALNLLSHPAIARNLSVPAYDALRGKVAVGFLAEGDVATAFQLSQASVKRSGKAVPAAAWTEGVAAWRLKKYEAALVGFATAASAENRDAWTKAGAAFWAARAADKLGSAKYTRFFLARAAQEGRTFYGLLARAALGQGNDLNWALPAFGRDDEVVLSRHPLGRAALQALAMGDVSAADAKLSQLKDSDDAALKAAALGFATRANLPGAALKLASAAKADDGRAYDVALYPLGRWIGDEDYRIDRALVHAIIWQESKFTSDARSTQGARGLMQLMPTTARYVMKVRGGGVTGDLNQSVHNLDVGQHYLAYLLDHDVVQGDMLRLLAAYNAGPGNLKRWEEKLGAEVSADPLLLIESLPSSETRAYIERVMAAYWIYRDRMGMANPTLTALVAGRAPVYQQKPRWASFIQVAFR